MSRKHSSTGSRRLVRGVIVAGAVFMTASAGTVAAQALTPAAPTAVHTSATVSVPLAGEDDLGWQ